MTVRLDEDGCDDIRPDQIVLSRRVCIEKSLVTIDDRLYCVYFDAVHHELDRTNATYIFVRMLDEKKAISLCPEDALPDLARALQMYDILSLSKS